MAVILVDLVLAVALLEAVGLLLLRRLAGRGPSASNLLPNLLAGLFLLLAVRLALAGVGWVALALCLAAAGMCHVLDLLGRWRSAG